MKDRIKPPAINRLELNFDVYEIGQIKKYFTTNGEVARVPPETQGKGKP